MENREAPKLTLVPPSATKEYLARHTKEWRANNPEKYREQGQKSIAKRRAKHATDLEARSHRDRYNAEYAAANLERINITATKRRLKTPVAAMIKAAKQRAVKQGVSMTLCVKNLAIPEFCPVLGIKMEFGIGKGTRSPSSPSLDRLDPRGGYTPENVRVISWKANRLKSDATLAELEAIVAYMKREA